MKVYCLVGKSGTGKSYQAGELCSKYGIDSIIDDGLFIVKGQIVAGISAKRQGTRVKAIKTALFTDDGHMRSVAEQIRLVSPPSILIIGTSDRMIGIIAKRLGLPPPAVRFDIEDFTTAEERASAYRQRHEQGKHVIPAPTFQIKKDFSGYFYHPIRSLRGMADFGRSRPKGAARAAQWTPFEAFQSAARGAVWDRSVVRPTYSYLGDYTISDKAIRDIIGEASARIDEIDDVPLVLVHTHREGAVIELGVIMRYGRQIVDAARKLQLIAAARIEDMTSINVIAVDVEIQGLAW
jgi:uncharacterized alkaline shock family protein YloU/adenylate kinase family enzyme